MIPAAPSEIGVLVCFGRGGRVVVYPLVQRDIDGPALARLLQRFAATLIENPSEAARVCGGER